MNNEFPSNSSIPILRIVWNNGMPPAHAGPHVEFSKNLQFHLSVQISTYTVVCVFWLILLQIFSVEWLLTYTSLHPASRGKHKTRKWHNVFSLLLRIFFHRRKEFSLFLQHYFHKTQTRVLVKRCIHTS